jgi:hypothetical protein
MVVVAIRAMAVDYHPTLSLTQKIEFTALIKHHVVSDEML